MSCISETVAQAEDATARITARLIRDAAEHMQWTGQTMLPAPGMLRTWLPLGNASLWAEYELLDDQCLVYRVLVNGQLIDPQDFIDNRVIEAWQSELWASHKQREAA